MSSSNIIIRTRYKNSYGTSKHISKWLDYVSKKEKADSTSLDEQNIMNEYFSLADKDSFLFEKCESFVWGMDGDVNPKKDIKNKININEDGFVWNLVISFPFDFSVKNGLITKSDFFDLTKNIMPSLITDMGLKIDNTIWYSALHRNTKNPHMHILIYEKKKTATSGFINQSAIKNMKRNIANYLVDNTKFYELRDKEFSNITGAINLKDLAKVKTQKLYSDSYRKGLNIRLLSLYSKLPPKGRLQYNSKNMIPYKEELNNIIEYILMHDSVKYNYANYLKLLETHQKELTDMYGLTPDNKNKKYYKDQLNRLYSKIGNEILSSFKTYQSMELINKEKEFLKRHIKDMNFKSRSDYVKEDTRISIAKDLYKLCSLAGLNYNETRKVFSNWIAKSKYNYDADSIISLASSFKNDMTSSEYFNALKRLGYDYEKYSKYRSQFFYKDINYKVFINKAINHLMYELEQEEKQIISELEYELEVSK